MGSEVAPLERRSYKTRTVKIVFRVIILRIGMLLVGCAVARTSYHVVTAPVHLFTGSSDEPSQTATTTIANAPEAAPPEQPIASPSPSPVRRRTQLAHTADVSASPSPAAPRNRQEPNAGIAASASPSPALAEFPTAKPVPGKPGYVFDPFDPNGGYIDVSGYAPGSKVKDPTSKKIFIVP
jgi:hypothetical protein